MGNITKTWFVFVGKWAWFSQFQKGKKLLDVHFSTLGYWLTNSICGMLLGKFARISWENVGDVTNLMQYLGASQNDVVAKSWQVLKEK